MIYILDDAFEKAIKDFPEKVVQEIVCPSSDIYSNEPHWETEFHGRQSWLLIQSLELLWKDRQDFYALGNLSIYYSPHQPKPEIFRGPDFFVFLGVERKPRKSWVVWAEKGRYPNVIVELVSPRTVEIDRGLKKKSI